MTSKSIATLVSQMTPPLELLNSDAIMMWRLEKAAELGAITVLGKKYNEFTNKNKYWKIS